MTVETDIRTRELLLVEDSPADARLTLEALRVARSSLRIHHVESGTEALRFLYREQPYADAPRPDLVLLDLNLPGLDGRDVLRQMKQAPALACIPVVVLTSSVAQTDVDQAYGLCANCYLVKPLGLDEYLALVQLMEQFWLGAARLPNGHHPGGVSVR